MQNAAAAEVAALAGIAAPVAGLVAVVERTHVAACAEIEPRMTR